VGGRRVVAHRVGADDVDVGLHPEHVDQSLLHELTVGAGPEVREHAGVAQGQHQTTPVEGRHGGVVAHHHPRHSAHARQPLDDVGPHPPDRLHVDATGAGRRRSLALLLSRLTAACVDRRSVR
jgi:hypothetical protein